MKTPRIHDFDPNATIPDLASPLDNFPSIKKPQAKSAEPLQSLLAGKSLTPPSVPSVSKPEQPTQYIRPYARTPVRRFITRYAFEFYQDQLEWLRSASLEEKARGEQGSMSKMVREALDRYIAKEKQKEED